MSTLRECARPASDLETRLDPTGRAPGEARRFVRCQLTALGFPNAVDDGELIVSELVTNAIVAAPTGTIFVALRIVCGYPLLEVWDQSPVPPVIQAPGPAAESGRGLRIVRELSAMFDWQIEGCWKVVWALLERG